MQQETSKQQEQKGGEQPSFPLVYCKQATCSRSRVCVTLIPSPYPSPAQTRDVLQNKDPSPLLSHLGKLLKWTTS